MDARKNVRRRRKVETANASAAWVEAFPTHMGLDTVDFVMSYPRRSGRVDIDRLRQISPRFVAAYEAKRPHEAVARWQPGSGIGA
jgi:hypothetical protein